LNSERHLFCFPITKPYLTGTVTDHHERRKGESSTTFYDFRHSVDINDSGLAETIVAAIPRVVFASTIISTAVASIVVTAILVLISVSHNWFLELQPGIAGCVGEGRYTAVVLVSAAVKNHGFDSSCFCSFSQ
jgi:hypothetical protein